ncbi:SDR family oxidoreductase [Glutamicibacter arilaitensis]|uniref:SDR family oxidoreductase n=1 Tax=Glutamicibacter arilaitensis TaxID=256701 RepID=A0A4Y8TW70_9MICC|nr:SDR family oxidoreductase [Glutamicibacter arilaitensis]TFH55819.1 SDR family oxidoreductase [Glutamicibacter arilaitensis]
MGPTQRIAVTGSTGALGALVARDLAQRGISQRLLVRTPSKAPDLPQAEVRQFDYADQASSREALDGVEVLFMVYAPEGPRRLDLHRSFIDAAKDAGVKHVVYTSFAAAAPDAQFALAREHHVTEQYLKDSGLRWTFLRDSFYQDLMPHLAGPDGIIRGPAGEGRFVPVARADVARAAAAVLAAPAEHASATYELTGPQSLDMADVARILSEAGGQRIVFHNETIEEAYASRAAFGAPVWQLGAWVSTYTAIASNAMSKVSNHVEIITGTPPISLEEYLRTAG